MKKISLFLQLSLLSAVFFASCVKDRNVGTDFSQIQPVLELRTPVSNIAGLAYFTRATIGNLPDTVQFYANLASEYTLDRDVNVTIGVDQSKIDVYNADTVNAVKYELLPDSTYTIFKTEGTIKSGQRIDSFQIAFYKDKIDATKNYMLPIVILDGDGVLLSANQSVIWFHAIGNPLAGPYLWDFIRWPCTDSTSCAPDIYFTGENTSFSPVDPTTIEVPSYYYIQPRYVLTFKNDGGVLSDFQVSLNQDDVDLMAANGVTVTDGPNILIADPVAGVFQFQYAVHTSTPADRYIKDTYYRP
ncbi:MAG TPA: DUF1735 domain-containing protein [Parafilimonas sp.]|nr:DUF1735 domain-containing protein [Parafilimonas sp.]